jgi:NAD(P)-dependent dehydrogenase (short-subunit alcohol dehydrogenase family)
MKISLEGKVALVTGGGAGIGRGIVDAFADIGAKIAVAELDPERCARLRADHPDALVSQCDVRDDAQVAKLAADIEAKFGRLDVLVNNAGDHCNIFKPLVKQTAEEIDQVYRANLRHIIFVTQAMIPLMKTSGEGGSIINFSSIEGFRGYPYNIIYTTFKSAVSGFTWGLSMELAGDNIRVNTIAPETTETEGVPLAQVIPADKRPIANRTIPLGRFGAVRDQAMAAVYLATDMSAWVTGTTLHVDGGGLTGNVFQRTPQGEWTNMPVVVGKASGDFQPEFMEG